MDQPSSITTKVTPPRPQLPGPIALLREAGQTLRIHFGTFLGIVLFPIIITFVGFLCLSLWTDTLQQFTLINSSILVITLLVLFLISSCTGNAMFQFLLIDPQTKNVIKIYRATFKRLGAVVMTNLILIIGGFISFCLYSAVAIMGRGLDSPSVSGWIVLLSLGFALLVLVVPLWLLIKFIFTQAVVMKEGRANFSAIRRSSALVKGLWWPIFWRFFIFGLAYAAYYILMNFIIGSVLQASTSDTSTTSFISNIFVTVVGEVTFGSIGYILIGRLYTILAGSTS